MLSEMRLQYGLEFKDVDGVIFMESRSIEDKRGNYTIGYRYNHINQINEFLEPILGKIVAMLWNRLIPVDGEIYTSAQLTTLIENNYVNLGPSAKLDSVLNYIHSQSNYDGKPIELVFPSPLFAATLYFNSIEEWHFYLSSAVNQELVVFRALDLTKDFKDNRQAYFYNLTVDGLSRLTKSNERIDSKFCFIAMAFVDEMYSVLNEAIAPALNETGFEPYIVSNIHVNSDITINDAILAGIKKSKFTIADFTYHRNGVYFEAGFALGRNQKVIYTCRQDEMQKAHFDIRNYQHIVWDNATDFKEKLINKIEAFIKD